MGIGGDNMIALKGRIIVSLLPVGSTTSWGFELIDRKSLADSGIVVSVGADSRTSKGKPIKAPCSLGDTVYFKKHDPQFHDFTQDGMRKGLCTIWFNDIIAVKEKNEKPN